MIQKIKNLSLMKKVIVFFCCFMLWPITLLSLAMRSVYLGIKRKNKKDFVMSGGWVILMFTIFYMIGNTNTEEIVTNSNDITKEIDGSVVPNTKIEENKTSEAKSETESNSSEAVKSESKPIVIEYDQLQQLYLEIDSDMNYEEILGIIVESGLPYAESKFNGSKAIIVAFEEGAAAHKYADSGDYVDIKFTEIKSEVGREYTFGNIEYFNQEKFITVFEHVDGTYWDFRGSEKAGLYINDYKDTYGKSIDEKYIKVESKEEQLKYVFTYER